jgi:twinkle protein
MYFDKLSDLGIKLTRRGGSEKCKCPQCSDGRKNKNDKPLSVNITTGEYNCHNCGFKGNVRSLERKMDKKKYEKPPQDVLKNIRLKEQVVKWFEGRGVSRGTLDKFMIFCKQEWMPQSQKEESCIGFPYLRDGEIVNIKWRDGRKGFKMHKDAELIFYNLNTIGEKKCCIITEGEIDCMSVYEAGFGVEKIITEDGELTNDEFSKWCVVSVPNGASKGNQRMEYLDNCSDWFIGLHEIVIATDGDEAGEMLRDELIRRLGVERCKTVSYPIEEVVPTENGMKRRCKDLNEVLQYLGKDVVVNVVNNADPIPIEGVYYLEEIFPSMLNNFNKGVQLSPTTRFNEADEYFRWKKGDINLTTGYANWGKTFFILQMMLTKSIWDGWRWAVFCPENYPANDFYDDLVEMYVGKWLRDMNVEEYTAGCKFIGEHIFYVYPEDSHDIHSINEKFRYLVLKKGIDGVLVDPFNQLDHLQKAYQREDQYISEVLKDIKRFALLNNIVYNLVAHPKNPSYQEGKILPVVDMYDIAGGAMFGNKVDLILSYHRPRFHEDKNSPEVEVHIQKLKRKRTGGKLGSFPLTLIWSKKRFAEDSARIPCDPTLAKMQGTAQPAVLPGGYMYLPYKDDNNDTVDF